MNGLLISYGLNKDLNNFLESIGSFWILDFLYIYLLTPTTIAGFFLNILSLKILHNKKFKASIYHYLKVYTFNSAMINFLSISSFMFMSKRIFLFTNNFISSTFHCYIFLPLMANFLFVSAIFDIIIGFEQIALFKKNLKIFKKSHTHWVSTITIVVVFILHLPYTALYKRSNASLNFNNTTHIVNYLGKTEFSSSLLGVVYLSLEFFIRDVLSMLILLVISIFSIFFMKKHFSRKLSRYGNSVLRRNSIYYVSFKKKLNRSDRKLTQMIVFKCFLSIIEHILLLFLWYSYNRKPDFVANVIKFVSNYFVTLKHSINFVTFYIFDANFKKLSNKI